VHAFTRSSRRSVPLPRPRAQRGGEEEVPGRARNELPICISGAVLRSRSLIDKRLQPAGSRLPANRISVQGSTTLPKSREAPRHRATSSFSRVSAPRFAHARRDPETSREDDGIGRAMSIRVSSSAQHRRARRADSPDDFAESSSGLRRTSASGITCTRRQKSVGVYRHALARLRV